MERQGPTLSVKTIKVKDGKRVEFDEVVGEEPLEIRLETPEGTESLVITMRTPGSDFDLVAGWLLAEGVVNSPRDIDTLRFCTDLKLTEEERFNVVLVRLRRSGVDLSALKRSSFATSACGVCGKTALDQVAVNASVIMDQVQISPSMVVDLPRRMREHQKLFTKTGGIHAAALFDGAGELLGVGEDVGRHNAVDKVVGSAFLRDDLSRAKILLASGRAGYEIVQKCAVAQIPILASVSAPSSLAVQVAKEQGITLIGFLRGDGFNLYTHEERINLDI